MKKVLVSYVIPVYNTEKYIEKCVESILEQNYKNIEIILVDDGSSDNSPMLLDNLKLKDNRIVVIHQKNGGVSKARNEGVKKSKGDYLCFIDSDDYIERDYTNYFLDLIMSNDYDMAVNYNCFNYKNLNQVKKEKTDIISSEKVMEYIYTDKINVAVWNKIYKRDFIIKNNISFDENIWYGEGMLYNIECLQYTDKVAVGNKKVYHQIYNVESAMRKFNLESNKCGIKSLYLQKELWKKKNKNIERAWNYHLRCFNYSILRGIIKSNSIELYKEEYDKCIEQLKHNIKVVLLAPIPIKIKIQYILLSINPVVFVKYSIKKEKKRAEVYIQKKEI